MEEKGFILILVLSILTSFMLIGFFMLDHFLIQHKINHNLYLELKTYYLAQSGIEYSTLRLKKKPTWRTESWITDLGEAGKFRVIVRDIPGMIHVQSYGIYEDYEYVSNAYLTQVAPVHRIK
ncbi:MAG: hypothetical protein KAX49_12520 [Halanaerobiales bacterium]|nr:hypothetical protein [Halanaerobiales bacterium]